MVALLAPWVAFGATHMGLSSRRLRPRLVAALGTQGFLGVYSAVALAIFVPLVWVYLTHRHAGPHLWYLGGVPGVRWAMFVGMGVSFALVVSGVAQPSPASLTPGRAEARGPLRVTRHPLFMGVGLLGALHLLAARVNAAELVFFGGLAVFSWLGCLHQDRRKLATEGAEFARFHAETGFLPFSRRGAWRGVLEAPVPMLAGAALAVVVWLLHPRLFGI